MPSFFFALCFVMLYCSLVIECLPNPSPLLNPTWGDPRKLVHLYTSSDRRSFHLAISLDGQVDGTPEQTAYSAMLIKSEERGLVAILGVKSERYLCMDAKGKLFSSSHCTKDCLFYQERLENGYDVYRSSEYNLVVNLGGSKHVYITGHNLPPYSQFLSRQNTVELEHFFHRQSRNVHTDPSDPFGMFSSFNFQHGARRFETKKIAHSSQAHSVSRERMKTTYHDLVDPDDPLRLLDHKAIISPRFFRS
ncbi:fibroblast growth factor 23 [Erpetoichthys calabaricus]|nr:fibroblast growth factor 23 [Erpetoichthys calabaricus]